MSRTKQQSAKSTTTAKSKKSTSGKTSKAKQTGQPALAEAGEAQRRNTLPIMETNLRKFYHPDGKFNMELPPGMPMHQKNKMYEAAEAVRQVWEDEEAARVAASKQAYLDAAKELAARSPFAKQLRKAHEAEASTSARVIAVNDQGSQGSSGQHEVRRKSSKPRAPALERVQARENGQGTKAMAAVASRARNDLILENDKVGESSSSGLTSPKPIPQTDYHDVLGPSDNESEGGQKEPGTARKNLDASLQASGEKAINNPPKTKDATDESGSNPQKSVQRMAWGQGSVLAQAMASSSSTSPRGKTPLRAIAKGPRIPKRKGTKDLSSDDQDEATLSEKSERSVTTNKRKARRELSKQDREQARLVAVRNRLPALFLNRKVTWVELDDQGGEQRFDRCICQLDNLRRMSDEQALLLLNKVCGDIDDDDEDHSPAIDSYVGDGADERQHAKKSRREDATEQSKQPEREAEQNLDGVEQKDTTNDQKPDGNGRGEGNGGTGNKGSSNSRGEQGGGYLDEIEVDYDDRGYYESSSGSDDSSEGESRRSSLNSRGDRRTLSGSQAFNSGPVNVMVTTATQFQPLVKGVKGNPKEKDLSGLYELFRKNVHRIWPEAVMTHLSRNGTITSWRQCIPAYVKDWLVSRIDLNIRSCSSADDRLSKWPEFHCCNYIGPEHEQVWRVYSNLGPRFEELRWDLPADQPESVWRILQRLFPATAVVSQGADRAQAIKAAINAVVLEPCTDLSNVGQMYSLVVAAVQKTATNEWDTLHNISVEDSQEHCHEFYNRLIKVSRDAGSAAASWCERAIQDLKDPNNTFFNEDDFRLDNGKLARWPKLSALCSWHQHFCQQNYDRFVEMARTYGYLPTEPTRLDKASSGEAPFSHKRQKHLNKQGYKAAKQYTSGSAPKQPPITKASSEEEGEITVAAATTAAEASKCNACGRKGHTREDCLFLNHKPPHPGANREGKWENSTSYQLLQKVSNPSKPPYTCLQFKRHVVKQADGKHVLQAIEAGPSVPKTPKKNKVNNFLNSLRSNKLRLYKQTIDLTSAFSLLCRSDRNILGTCNGQHATTLVDTGSTDFNFVDRSFVKNNKLPIRVLPCSIRVRSVHNTSTVNEYSIVPVELKYRDNILTMVIPCLILDSSPRDIILGLPAITKYNILEHLKEYFIDKGEELAQTQERLFKGLIESKTILGDLDTPSRSESSQTRMSSAFAITETYPHPRAPILPMDKPTMVSAHGGQAPETVDGQTRMSPGNRLSPTYTVQHRDELLDVTVEPDNDSMPVEDEPPDPIAREPINPTAEDQPKLFGPPALQRRLKRLITKYKHVFATQLPTEPAHITPVSFNIDAAGWRADKRSKQYARPLSHDKEIALEQWISVALQSGIISEAPAIPNWSQILLVLKPNGKEYRFCVDYTVLNSFMESAGWPIPHIGSVLRRIATNRPKYFATMDSTQGFYQMEVEMSSREFLCFTTYLGNYVWNRAPMGPKTVPAFFQRAMCVEVFPDLVHKIMEVYIDDFIVWAQTEDELITRLEAVFMRLSEKNLKLNPKKCRFGMTEVEYCGHVINDKGTTFSAERISEVSDFSVPQNHGELKSFLGMAGYMREHIPHYVEMAQPLQNIVRHYVKRTRKQKIEWTPELLQSFDDFKASIAKVYTLYHRDEEAPLRLYTDASSYGIGAYLCQVKPLSDGTLQEQPLGFISKSLSDTERRWSVYEKEGYAIFYACKKWEHFLRGNHFFLFTDHKNLTFLNRPPSEKVMRWRLAIQEFDFSVAYIKGETNNVADAMSRCTGNGVAPENNQGERVYTKKEVRDTTLHYLHAVPSSDRLESIPSQWYDILENEHRQQYFVQEKDLSLFLGLLDGTPHDMEQLCLEERLNNTSRSNRTKSLGGVTNSKTPKECSKMTPHKGGDQTSLSQKRSSETFVYTLLCSGEAEAVPELVQNEVVPLQEEIHNLIASCHNTDVGHGGVDRTLNLLEQLRTKDPSKEPIFTKWTFKRADVRRFVKACPICQKIKQHQLLKYTPHFTTSTYGIFDNISIDTVYMPESARGNKYLIVVIDSFSRYLDVYPISELSAKTAMTCLIQFMSNFGIPSHLCCDNGSQFQGLFQELIDLLTINGYKTHPYSHQENSIVERANKEILTTLRALVLERRLKDDWDILCHVAKRIINSRIHSAIGIAPADLVFAGRIDLQRGSLFPYPTPEVFSGHDYMHTLMQHQEQMLNTAVKLQKEHDATRLKDNAHALKTVFPLSSYVLVKPEVEPSNKLAPRWLGPYLVTQRFERREGDVYRCLHLSTNREFDFRVDRLDPYYTYDESTLHDTAMLDDEQYEVEQVLRHRFNGAQLASNLQLEIKWLGYDKPDWQPYSGNGLNEVGIVHEYLRQQKLAKFIPQKFR